MSNATCTRMLLCLLTLGGSTVVTFGAGVLLVLVTFGVLANLSEQMSMQSVGVCDSTLTESIGLHVLGTLTTTAAI